MVWRGGVQEGNAEPLWSPGSLCREHELPSVRIPLLLSFAFASHHGWNGYWELCKAQSQLDGDRYKAKDHSLAKGRKIIMADPRTQEAKAAQGHVGHRRGWDNSCRCWALSLDYKAVCTGKYTSQLLKDDASPSPMAWVISSFQKWFWTNVCIRPLLCLIVMTTIHPTDWH